MDGVHDAFDRIAEADDALDMQKRLLIQELDEFFDSVTNGEETVSAYDLKWINDGIEWRLKGSGDDRERLLQRVCTAAFHLDLDAPHTKSAAKRQT